MNNKFIFVCNSYNPPKDSQYQYDLNKFERTLSAMPNEWDACILHGELNFPSTNWHTLLSNSEEESQIINLLDSIIFQHEIKFPTCFRNTLHAVSDQIIVHSAEVVENFNEVNACSDHVAIKVSVDCSIEESNPLLQFFRSFGSVDYAGC